MSETNRKSNLKTLTLLTAALLLSSFSVSAQTRAAGTENEKPSPAEKYFTNTELINQDGETVRFYSDVLKGKVVVINCFFATCQGSCLPMNRNVAKVQELFGDRVGRDVFFVSITVDPEMDTPAQLKKYATLLHARSGWIFLTGQKANVDFIQRKLGQYVADKNGHANVVIVGNEPTGLWKKMFGLAKPEEIYKVIESVIADKESGGSQ